jgi:hypothetical protein
MAQDGNARDEVTRRSRRVPDRTLITLMTVLLLVIVGIFVYRMSTRPAEPDLAGDRSSVDSAGEQLPGGSDPQPKFGSTRDEIENRGGGSVDAVTRLSDITDDRQAVSGQRVELKDVEVESASADSFWITDGDDTIAVVAPAGTPALRDGQRVSISGRVEANGGNVRINATRVQVTG